MQAHHFEGGFLRAYATDFPGPQMLCFFFFFNYYYLLSFHCFFPWRGGWEGGRKWVKPRESKLVENEKGMLSNLCNGRKIDR